MTESTNDQDADSDSDLDVSTDPFYEQAVMVVLKTRRPSISLLQRALRIGFNRAGRMLDTMERNGIVSAIDVAGNRSVLLPASELEISDADLQPTRPPLSLAAKALVVPFGLAVLAGLGYAISKVQL